jgi:hypothetical protein
VAISVSFPVILRKPFPGRTTEESQGGCHRNPKDEKFLQNLSQNLLTAVGRTLYNISRYIEIILDMSYQKGGD